jgi:hypothetical protein
MLITLENGLAVDLIYPQKKYHKVIDEFSDRFKIFTNYNEVIKATENRFFVSVWEVTETLDDFGNVVERETRQIM